METSKIEEGEVKWTESPREARLIRAKERLENEIADCEITLELDKEMLTIVNKKLEKFK